MSKTKNTEDFQKMIDDQELSASFNYQEQEAERTALFDALANENTFNDPEERDRAKRLVEVLKEIGEDSPEDAQRLLNSMVNDIKGSNEFKNVREAEIAYDKATKELDIAMSNYADALTNLKTLLGEEE